MYNLKEIRTRADWFRYAKIVETTNWTSFTMHPDWLHGFELVPFLVRKFGYFIYNEDNIEIGCISGIKFWLGKWITIYPSDPLYFVDFSIEDKKQLWREVLNQSNSRTHVSSMLELESIGLKRAKFPRGVYPNPGIGAVNINISEEEYLKTLKYGVRRKINQGKQDQANLKFSTVTDKNEFREFYELLKLNSFNAGYKIRPYLLLRNFWINGLKNNSIVFLKLYKNDKLVGCSVLIKAGNMINYIMGASDKTFQKLNAGYLLHLKSMEICRNLGYGNYNISIGGTQTVEKLKDDFGREKVNLTKQYVSILNK
jgi:hypothetical protein